MFNITKLNLLWEKVKRLEESGGGGSDLPDISPSDYGSYLAVDELGKWGLDKPKTGVDYSTTEQDTGTKWIDGKTIYSKTIDVDFSSLEKGIDNLISHSIENLDRCVNLLGSVKYGVDWLTFPYATGNNTYALQISNVNTTNFTIAIGNGFTLADFTAGYVTLFYTKTTTTTTKKKNTKNKED